MQKIYKLFIVVFAHLLLMPLVASAQTSSVNAYSPYSMYGPGELLTPGTVQMRSMGGVGIGLRTTGQINTLNPAAASVIPSKSFLFEASFDGTHYRNSQPKFDASGMQSNTARTAYNTANIHSLALALPIARNLGVNLSVSPYSSVGYKLQTTDQNNDNWADIGRVVYGHVGEGDITEVKLSMGWSPWRNFAIGVAAKYFWGNIEREYSTVVANNITGSGTIASTLGVDSYRVNNFKMQVGLQWNIIYNEERILTLGATYDLGGNLNPEKKNYVYTENSINSIIASPIRNRIERVELRVPHQVGVGIYYHDRTFGWGADYNYAAWGDNNEGFNENSNASDIVVAYTNTHTVKLGFEVTPRRNDVRNYLNRITYRIGARLGNYYQTFAGEQINQLAITAGFGFPIKIWGASSINLGFEYGRLSSASTPEFNGAKVGMVTQNYYKLSLGFSLFSADTSDYWFVRQKFD